jgi:hypothetical protein
MARSSRPARSPLWWASARSGCAATILGASACVVVSVLCWLPDAGVSGRPGSAIRAGLLAFLAAQGSGIRVDGVHAEFLPLGLLIGVLVIAWRAGRTLAAAAIQSGDTDPRRLRAALATQTATYAVGCGVLVPLSRLGTSSVSLGPVLLWSAVMFALAAGAALAAELPLLDTSRLPPALARNAPAVGRSALGAVASYVGFGALLATGSLVLHGSRVMELSRQVVGGLSGLPVLVLDVLCAPNAALAGSAYLAGPGFAVGTGTTVSLGATSHGVLPAFPILGAIPDGHGANTVTLVLVALAALSGGVVAAVLLDVPGSWREHLAAWACAGLLAGAAMAALAWKAGGAVGPGRLHAVGASPWRVGLAVAAAVLLVSAVILLGQWLWRLCGPWLTRRFGPPSPPRPVPGADPQAPPDPEPDPADHDTRPLARIR